MDRKVFCIGWHKTGTSTLGIALLRLGYTVVGARLDLEDSLRKGDLSCAIALAGQFDAVQDVPWAALYKELDRAYPKSRFIFTDRDDASWLRSAVSHFRDQDISLHEWLYGNGRCLGNEDLYIRRFRQHRREVREWFADRPEDFLEMNFERGDAWEVLCEFLGCPVPKEPWPHLNKGKHNRSKLDVFVNGIRRVVPNPVRRTVFLIRLRIRAFWGLPDPRNRFNNFEENRRAKRKMRMRRQGR